MRRKGFTLLELSVVLSVLGILIALAVPGFRTAILKAKAAEARTVVEAIADAEQRHYRDSGKYLACESSPTLPPGSPASFDASRPGWKELGFQIDGPVRYRYEVVLVGTSFKVTAAGDLDGDGVRSTYTLDGSNLALAITEELE
jgi:prepilin-type N-terminal cleavage/methylation domain-containing protein